MKLTWKREKRESGLRKIGAPPTGSKLHDGNRTYATTASIGGGMHGNVRGWYWVAGWDSDVPHKNTCNAPCETEDDAKKAAREYVMAHLPSND